MVSGLRLLWSPLLCRDNFVLLGLPLFSGYLLQGSHWSRSSCGSDPSAFFLWRRFLFCGSASSARGEGAPTGKGSPRSAQRRARSRSQLPLHFVMSDANAGFSPESQAGQLAQQSQHIRELTESVGALAARLERAMQDQPAARLQCQLPGRLPRHHPVPFLAASLSGACVV